MLNRARSVIEIVFYLTSCVVFCGCTEVDLYHKTAPPLSADRVTLQGRVCTEDPDIQRFPVRMILLIDQGQGPLYSEYDPGQLRFQALNNLIQSALTRPEYALTVFSYAGRARRLAPEEGTFTRNPGELLNAITQLSLPGQCIGGGICRDYQGGLEGLQTLIEDDLAEMEAGARAMTQYRVLWVAAGPQTPLAKQRDCCPRGDRTCTQAESGQAESPRCQAQLDLKRVQALRTAAMSRGAGGFQLNILHLAAEDSATNRQMSQLFEQLSFAGGGRYRRFGAAGNIDLRALSLFERSSDLEAAQVMIVNQSAAPRLTGLLADSDQDGLADREEDRNQNGRVDEGESDPLLADSDDDGINDLIEARIGLVNGERDEPSVCDDLIALPEIARADRDLDGLNECEERLVGTDPSLSDTDGDQIPDGVEFKRGTDHLNPDSAEDFDEDGVSNGDEVREGTDPRSIDEAQRLGLAARYTVTREGRIRELNPDQITRLEGVRLLSVGSELAPGLATFQWIPIAELEELEEQALEENVRGALYFRSPQNTELGAPTFITESGRYQLQGDLESDSDQWAEVEVALERLPEVRFTEDVLIRERERSCLNYTVRNLRLVEIQPTERDLRLGRAVGANEVFVYLAQKARGQSEAAGRFRIARVPIYYQAPATRSPSGVSLEVEESEFVSPQVVGP